MAHIKASPLPDDHIDNLRLIEIKYDNDKSSLAFISKSDYEVVTFERLQEIHAMISKTLEKRKAYDSFRAFVRDVNNIKRNKIINET